jgi:SAM-dependent methyltransferase
MTSEATPSARHPDGVAPAHRGHHDWHSPDYVQEWVADYEARAADRLPQFELLADLVPHPTPAPLRILDVGAGWGPLTRHLLGRYPEASAVLLDFSAPMLDEARARLAGDAARVTLVAGDLSQPGAIAAAVAAGPAGGAPFDAVVSSLCVHNLRPAERVPALYREIREAVAPGGCFLNLDLMGGAVPPVQAAWHRARVERARRRRLAETGTLPSYEEVDAALRARTESHGGPGGGGEGAQGAGFNRALLDHLRWLLDAGFAAAECFWRQDRQALVGGFRA